MSIIHDALKKIQEEKASKANETPAATGASKTPASNYIYASSPETTPAPDENLPIEYLPPSPKKARSLLGLLCIIAFFIGCVVFSYKQLHPYFYKEEKKAKLLFYKLMHKQAPPDLQAKATENHAPLAKIVVNPPKPVTAPKSVTAPKPMSLPAPLKPLSQINLPAVFDTTDPQTPETLNIHGVMSNGPNNVVLINDQVYQEGDEVDGVKIVKIKIDSITVDNNGKEEVIPVR